MSSQFERSVPLGLILLEREATLSKKRHGEEILFGDNLWAEAGEEYDSDS